MRDLCRLSVLPDPIHDRTEGGTGCSGRASQQPGLKILFAALNLFTNFEQFALADNLSRLRKHLRLFFFSMVFNQVF